MPTHKFVDNSKILQLAFLDKIIEDCDEDLTKNQVQGNLKNFHSFLDSQQEKIKNDDLKIELQIQKEEDFEYQPGPDTAPPLEAGLLEARKPAAAGRSANQRSRAKPRQATNRRAKSAASDDLNETRETWKLNQDSKIMQAAARGESKQAIELTFKE